MERHRALHEKAQSLAKQFRKLEAELFEILLQIDKEKLFRLLGYSSLFTYATQALKLSESQAYNFVNVARKTTEVPELKTAVTSGKLSVSKARRIVPVLKPCNQKQWIEKAIALPQREVERAVACENPQLKVPERIRLVAKERCELKCGITPELEKQIRRVQDLLSQKRKRPCSLEETLEALTGEYLERHDPVRKAERQKKLGTCQVKASRTIPSSVKHQVVRRDRGHCQYHHPSGKPCGAERWVELHHRVPLFQGGDNSANNLITLCSAHHKHVHDQRRRQ